MGTGRPAERLIRLEGLIRRFGSLTALDCPRMELAPGAIGLLGPNGAGKSTLLKILLGLLPPSEGTAELLGLDARRHARAVRARVGYLPEHASLAPGMKAFAMVALAGELCGMPRRDSLRRAHEVLTYLGVEEARYRPVEQLSTGMRQRILLAQGLVHDPELLVLDEPTNGLDPAGRKAMLDLITSLHREFGKSVILSSHLLDDVDRVCDSLIILQGGRVVAHGRTEDLRLDLRQRYRLRLTGPLEAFLGRIAAEGVSVVGVPRPGSEETEILVQVPQGWTNLRFLGLLEDSGSGGGGPVLRALIPEKEKLSELFGRIAAGAANGAMASGAVLGEGSARRSADVH